MLFDSKSFRKNKKKCKCVKKVRTYLKYKQLLRMMNKTISNLSLKDGPSKLKNVTF